MPTADAWNILTATPAPAALVDLDFAAASAGRMLFLVAAVAGIIVGGGAGFVGFPLLVASVAEAIAPIRVDDEVARPEALDTFRPPPEAA